MKRIITIATLCLLMAVYKAEAIDLSSWAYKSTITFSGYGKTETLTNFPALVQIGTNISGYSPSQSLCPVTNGCDLRFTLADGTTELNYEKELWSNSTLTNSIFWVQVPLLTNGTQIVAYWGKSTNSPAYTTNGATWGSSYVGVWHLADLTTSTIKDSTSNYLTGAKLGANLPMETNGVMGKAQYFNGSSAAINIGENPILSVTNMTIEVWVKAAATQTAWAGILGKHFGTGNDYMLQFNNLTGNILLYQQSSISFDTGYQLSVIAESWNYLVVTHNGSNVISYRNGAQVIAGSLVPPTTTAGTLTIGQERTGIKFAGSLDEIRICNISQSSNWVWACYQNMASNGVFQGYGTATAQSSGNPAAMFQAIMSLLE